MSYQLQSPSERNRLVGQPLVKGNTILGSMLFVEREYPEGVSRVLEEVSPATRTMFDGIVLAGGSYPFEQLHDLARVICEVVPGGLPVVGPRLGAFLMDRDLQGGIYRTMLKLSSPRFMVNTLARLWGLYHYSGALRVLEDRPGFVRLLLHGIYQPSPPIVMATMGAARRAIELAGAKHSRHRLLGGASEADRYCEFALEYN